MTGNIQNDEAISVVSWWETNLGSTLILYAPAPFPNRDDILSAGTDCLKDACCPIGAPDERVELGWKTRGLWYLTAPVPGLCFVSSSACMSLCP